MWSWPQIPHQALTWGLSECVNIFIFLRTIGIIISVRIQVWSIRRWHGAHTATSVCKGGAGSRYHREGGGCKKAFYDTFLGISPSSLFFPEQRHKLGTCLVGMKKVGLKVKLDTGDTWVGDIIGSVWIYIPQPSTLHHTSTLCHLRFRFDPGNLSFGGHQIYQKTLAWHWLAQIYIYFLELFFSRILNVMWYHRLDPRYTWVR